jgi:hypothetical protein
VHGGDQPIVLRRFAQTIFTGFHLPSNLKDLRKGDTPIFLKWITSPTAGKKLIRHRPAIACNPMAGPWPHRPFTFHALSKTYGQMWLRC